MKQEASMDFTNLGLSEASIMEQDLMAQDLNLYSCLSFPSMDPMDMSSGLNISSLALSPYNNGISMMGIPNLPPIPDQFCTQFHEYNKESYLKSTGPGRKRSKTDSQNYQESSQSYNSTQSEPNDSEQPLEIKETHFEDFNEIPTPQESDNSLESKVASEPVMLDLDLSPAELKRQIHIQSEQKRRAQIRDGFEELRSHLPTPHGTSPLKAPSKAAILARTVIHLQHLKQTQMILLKEIDRLRFENEQLRQAQTINMLNSKGYSSLYQIGL